MYEIRRADNGLTLKTLEQVVNARAMADRMFADAHELFGLDAVHFNVFKVEQVYTTQLLGEAYKPAVKPLHSSMIDAEERN